VTQTDNIDKARLRKEGRSPDRPTRAQRAPNLGNAVAMNSNSSAANPAKGRGFASSGGLETAAPSCASALRADAPSHVPVFAAPFLLLIKIYQWTLSPLLHALSGPNAGCRFYPSCSCYAAEALRTHGVLRGAALAAWRLARCNPFNAGGVDLVPTAPAPARPRCERVQTSSTLSTF